MLISNKLLAKIGGITFASATGIGIYFLSTNKSNREETKKILDVIIEEQVKQEPKKEVEKVPIKEQAKKASKLFKSNNRKLLNQLRDEAKWNSNWKSFKQKFKKAQEINDFWKFKGLEVALEYDFATPAFKEHCTKNGEIEVKGVEDPIYIGIRDYCTEEIQK